MEKMANDSGKPTTYQRVSYHEAAHAVATLRVGLEFVHIALTPDDPERCGRLRRYGYQLGRDLQELLISLAGPAAEERMHKLWGDEYDDDDGPDMSWDHWDGPGSRDILDAMAIIERAGWSGERGRRAAWRFLWGMVRSTVRPFVRERWREIVQLGDALHSAPDQTLSYKQCRTVLNLDVEARSPGGDQGQGGSPTFSAPIFEAEQARRY